jgi:hydrogenase nickel incorporation protein HypA/HybF
MHELSIAMSIVDRVEEELTRLGGAQLDAVHLRVGLMSGLVSDALASSYTFACEGTALAGSRLVIELVEGRELLVRALELRS